MRTISADNNAILLGGARQVAHRIQVKDAGGTFRDLSTYPGIDLFEEGSWSEDLDSPGVTWDVTLTREQELVSVAPLMENSPLNRAFNPAANYAALLQVGRQMKIEYSLQAEDDPRTRTWALAFAGYIDGVDSGGSGDQVKLRGRGLEAAIINCFIERERIYAFAQGANADRGVYVWTPSTVWVVGDRVVPTDAKLNDHFYRVTTGGTGGTAEPAWPTGGASTVADGGATFTESGATSTSAGTAVETVMQQILNDNMGGAAPTLWCPVSPSWNVQWFLVGRQPTFDELKLLADQIGWCIRYMDDAGTPKLKFFDPNRSSTTSLRSFGPSEVDDYRRLSTDWQGIRNVLRVIYSDSQDLDAAGNPKRKTIERTDSASITKYGRLFAEIAEASNSNIDTSTEATTLADAVLSDLAEPTADMEAALLYYFPFIEVADLYTLSADGVHFDSDQKLAVVSFTSQVGSDGSQSTSFRLRGKPASNGKKGWFQRMSDADGAKKHQLTARENVARLALTADATPIGGARIGFDWKSSKKPHDTTFELHISEVGGFIADSSTLFASGKEREVEVGNLNPAIEYSAVVVPITWNADRPVRGSQSAEIQFTPGRAKATHLEPNVMWGRLPLNGGFETNLDPSAPPDFWFLANPAEWGAGVELGTSGGLSGSSYIKIETLDASMTPSLSSAEFSINELIPYAPSYWRKCVAGSGANVEFAIAWFDEDHVHLGNYYETVDLGDNVGSWVKTTLAQSMPLAGARFARLYIHLIGGASGREIHVDNVEVEGFEPPSTVASLGVDLGTYGSLVNDSRIFGVVAKNDANGNGFATWGLTPPGEFASSAEVPTAPNPRAWNHYGASGTINAFAGMRQTNVGDWAWVQGPRLQTLIQVYGSVANRRVWVALTSANLDQVSTNSAARYVGLRYDSAVGPNWYLCSADTSTASDVDTGIAVVADTDYSLDLDFSNTSLLRGKINGVTTTKATDLPSGTTFGKHVITVTSLIAAATDILWHHTMISRK